MSYQLTPNANCILRLEDKVFIPASEDNSDYQEYLIWLAQGNTPAPIGGDE